MYLNQKITCLGELLILNFCSDFEAEILSARQCRDFFMFGCVFEFEVFIDVDNVSAVSQPEYVCNVCLFTISDGK